MIYDKNFPNKLQNKYLSIVYFILVNDELYKIGQTLGKGGIKDAMQFYLIVGSGSPGINRFTINALIRKEIKDGNKVELYMQYAETINDVEIKGIFSIKKQNVLINAKTMEQVCLEDYQKKHGQNKFPKWNFQESHTQPSDDIKDAYYRYRLNREKSNK
ncbi:MAG: hypothetical protein ACR2NY_00225 [Alphaproteobacteria bacterium]